MEITATNAIITADGKDRSAGAGDGKGATSTSAHNGACIKDLR